MNRGPIHGNDRGSSWLSTTLALAVFLIFVSWSVQTLSVLHARTVVTTAATTAARSVAGADVDRGDPQALAAARRRGETRARDLLGRSAQDANVEWHHTDTDQVRVTISIASPGLLPVVAGVDAHGRITRTVSIRSEALR